MVAPLFEKAADVLLGDGCEIDAGVILGCLSGRKIPARPLMIGSGARVRSGTVIYAGTNVGTGLDTGHHVVIREENEIGDNLCIWNSSTIDYGCTVGCCVKIHCNVYVAQYTVLEDGVFLAPGVTIANDLHPLCGRCMRGPTVGRNARIGVNVTLMPRIFIGEGAVIGAGSVVTRDIPPFMVAFGNPARVYKPVDELTCPYHLVEYPYEDGLDVQTRERLAKDLG